MDDRAALSVAGLAVSVAAALVLGLLAVLATILLAVGAAGSGFSAAGAYGAYGASPGAVADIPPAYLALYQRAGARYGLDWAILAGVGKVECDHGRDPDPSCRREGAINSAGAGGPAQFLAGTWAQYGVDGNGDGRKDRWNPADAIFAMAHYLRASGAPRDWHRALFAYNHANWYVALVLRWAGRYRGALQRAQSAPGAPLGAAPAGRRVPFGGRWLGRLPGTRLDCDVRIIPDVLYLMSRFRMRATACFAASGHASGGEHPLGLALDAVPADGDWAHALALARAFGWRASCGASGCVGRLRAPMRFIGYNGYPGHGDPAHAGANSHIHLSFAHAPAAPLTPARWVEVF